MKKQEYVIARKLSIFIALVLLIQYVLGIASLPAASYERLTFHNLYTTEETIDIVFVGTSRYRRAIDPAIIDEKLGVNSYNFATTQQAMIDSYFILQEIYKTQSPKLVVLDITWHRLYEKTATKPSYIVTNYMRPSLNKLSYMANTYDLDTILLALLPGLQNPNVLLPTRLLSNVKTKFTYQYRDYEGIAATKDDRYYYKGFVYSNKAKEEGHVGALELNSVWDESLIDSESIKYLDLCVRLCQENGSMVLCIGTPAPAGAMSVLGNYTHYTQYLRSLLDKYGVKVYNFSLARPSLFDSKDSYFYDAIHMNGIGAEAFSNALAKLLMELDQDTFDEAAFFHPSFEEMILDNPRVLSAWLKYDKKSHLITASSTTGVKFDVEYSFSYKDSSSSTFVPLREYDLQEQMDLSILPAGKYIIRVEARIVGSQNKYEQWDELSIELSDAL